MRNRILWISSIVFCILIIFFSVGSLSVKKQKKEQIAEIRKVEKLISAIPQEEKNDGNDIDKDVFEQFIETEKSRYFSNEVNEDLFEYGQKISGQIKSRKLEILYYNVYRKGEKPFFNYTIKGNTLNCLNLIYDLSHSEKYFQFENLTLDDNNGIMTMSILFSPVMLPDPKNKEKIPGINNLSTYMAKKKPSDASLMIYSKLFYHPPPVVLREKPQEVPQAVSIQTEEKIPDAPSWLSYTGHSVENDIHCYYFSDSRTNRIIKVIPESTETHIQILKIEEDGFLIELSGEKYYVYK